ncbi:MAG: tetratricopeptide repeat protein [Gemmataceae bacterium]|nr:tetratricopeptide repeat protein [Gemmataceae bacterium]MDW8266905.1 tetratricopeptide repeat protein [Gemmataceae bacterium]
MLRAPWRHSSGQLLLVGLGLALATVATFAPCLGADFLEYDDPDYVTANPHVCSGLSLDNVRWALTATDAGNWHPLTWLSLQVDAQIFGLRPWGFHLTNVLLHAANTVLLVVVLRRLTGCLGRSAMVAALFAWHPLRVESVAWVAERKDVLSGFFALLTILAYGWYVERPHARRLALVGGMFALGLMAKPMLVTLPGLLLLLDVWPLERLSRAPLRGLVVEKIPLFLLVVGACALTLHAQRQGGAVKPLDSWPIGQRLANAAVAYVAYLGKAVWPVHLAVLYPHPRDRLGMGEVWGATLLLLALTAAALTLVRRPYLLVGWLWYLGTLVPVIGLVQVGEQAYADRYTYLPLIGVFLAGVWAVADGVTGVTPRAVLAGAILTACGLLTFRQATYWRDTVTLWEHTVAVTECNPVAHRNLGLAYLRRGRWDDAEGQLQAALALDPEMAGPQYFLGEVHLKRGEWAQAEERFRRAAACRPEAALPHNGLGLVALKQGRFAEAERAFAEAVRRRPQWAEAHSNRGLALWWQGETAAAVVACGHAVMLDPETAAYHRNLAMAQLTAGRAAEAAASFDRAGQLQPGWVTAAWQTAWRLATAPDPRRRDPLEAATLAWQAWHAAPTTAADLRKLLDAAQEAAQAAQLPALADALARRRDQLPDPSPKP